MTEAIRSECQPISLIDELAGKAYAHFISNETHPDGEPYGIYSAVEEIVAKELTTPGIRAWSLEVLDSSGATFNELFYQDEFINWDHYRNSNTFEEFCFQAAKVAIRLQFEKRYPCVVEEDRRRYIGFDI